MTEHPADRAQFHAMAEGTQEDWMKIGMAAMQFNTRAGRPRADPSETARRRLRRLRRGPHGTFAAIGELAHRDGMDEEYVVCALLHDIGDTLASHNHAELAATMLKPFVSEENCWMLQHHGIFQGYYFFHYLGLDRNMRDQFRGHPNFERTAMFCARHDQNAFDPKYDTMPLEAFVPMVQRVMAKPKRSIYLRDAAKEAAE